MGYMGPVVGDVQHEGYPVPLFADGAEGAGSYSGKGVLVDFESDEWRPDAAVIGWRMGCECGWRGQAWTRVARQDQADAGARLVYSDDAFLDDDVERPLLEEWQQHIAPFKAVESVEEAAAKYGAAGGELDEAVRAARAAGATWAAIGRAAGITRQSAQERWGNR